MSTLLFSQNSSHYLSYITILPRWLMLVFWVHSSCLIYMQRLILLTTQFCWASSKTGSSSMMFHWSGSALIFSVGRRRSVLSVLSAAFSLDGVVPSQIHCVHRRHHWTVLASSTSLPHLCWWWHSGLSSQYIAMPTGRLHIWSQWLMLITLAAVECHQDRDCMVWLTLQQMQTAIWCLRLFMNDRELWNH